MTRAWTIAGFPPGNSKPIGSFESWSATAAGILKCAGARNFLANTEEMNARLDIEAVQSEAFLMALRRVFGEKQQSDLDWLERAAAVHDAQSAAEQRSLLNIYFPQYRRACDWHACPYHAICFGSDQIAADPIGSGLYTWREPHHAAERELIQLRGRDPLSNSRSVPTRCSKVSLQSRNGSCSISYFGTAPGRTGNYRLPTANPLI